ncbi:MAG TPA: hypothetical protein VM864_03250 [Pyrinomonadaceae bacterium]|jgi:hypothetical protein|nr:hypothetical protein [Pyrinomonadaceae bacterium]
MMRAGEGGVVRAKSAAVVTASVLLMISAVSFGVGCAAGTQTGANANAPSAQTQQQQQPASSAQQPPAAQTRRVTADDLKKLRWIEGAWRGTGDVQEPFFERYRFESETTLAVEGFKDQTLGKADDVTRFELRDGVFGNWGEGSRWAATELEEGSVTFSPVAKARNTFRWQRESADVWKAVLDYPASEGKPARQRVYRMERLPQPKS